MTYTDEEFEQCIQDLEYIKQLQEKLMQTQEYLYPKGVDEKKDKATIDRNYKLNQLQLDVIKYYYEKRKKQ